MTREPKRWALLKDILGKGGKFREEFDHLGNKLKTFYAPYTFFAEVPGSDAMAIVVLAGKEIPVYRDTSRKSAVIATYSDEALAVVFGNRADNRTWFELKLPSGENGFVPAGDVATTADYRVGIIKTKKGWMLHSFIGGE